MDREAFIEKADAIAQDAAFDGYNQSYSEREFGLLFDQLQKAEHNSDYTKCKGCNNLGINGNFAECLECSRNYQDKKGHFA